MKLSLGKVCRILELTGSTNCIAKVGLSDFPCNFPFELNGQEYQECIENNKTGIPECLVSKSNAIWGICDPKRCNLPGITLS
jgi:hypothetical protein